MCLIHLSIQGIPFLGQGGLCLGLGVSAFFLHLGLGVSAFLVGGFAHFLLGVCSVLLILSCRVVLRIGLAMPSPFGFSSYSYNSGVRISWWGISLACLGYCTQTLIVFLGSCQEYKSLKFNSIIIINDYHYYQLSFSSIIIALHRKPNCELS